MNIKQFLTKMGFLFLFLSILLFSCSHDLVFPLSGLNARFVSAELLKNPGFEDPGAADWDEDLSSSVFAFDAAGPGEVRTGSAARGYWFNSGSTGDVQLSQRIDDAQPGEYVISLWTRRENYSTPPDYARVKVLAGTTLVAQADLPYGGLYGETTFGVIELSSAVDLILLVEYRVDGGNAYLTIDDASVKFSPAEGQNQILNNGFEIAGAEDWWESVSPSTYAFDTQMSNELRSGMQARGYWLNSGSQGDLTLSQDFSSLDSGMYSASVWVRRESYSLPPSQAHLQIWIDSNLYESALLPYGGSYQIALIENIPVDQGASVAFRVLYTVPGGNAYLTLDDAKFIREGDYVSPPPPVEGDIYVSPAGSDSNSGSVSNPFKTVAHAASVSRSGQTIYLSAGTFFETEAIELPPEVNLIGAGETETVISSYTPVPHNVDASSPDWKLWYDGSLIQLVSDHYSVFRNNKSTTLPPVDGNQILTGFTVDGYNKTVKAGIWLENRNNVELSHITFRNLDMRGAVLAAGDKDWYIEPAYYLTGIKAHDLTFINSGKDLNGETLGNLNIAQLDGAEIYNITINDTEGYGLKFIFDGYLKNCHIHDLSISVSEDDPLWGEDISIELWNFGPGNEIYNVQCNTWLSMVNHAGIFATPGSIGENLEIRDVKIIDQDGISHKEAVELMVPGALVRNGYFENKGFGIAIWDNGGYKVGIYRNIFTNTSIQSSWAQGGVYINNSTGRTYKELEVFHNVFDTYSNAITAINSGSSWLENMNIKNNIFLNINGKHVDATGTDITFAHNMTDSMPQLNGISSLYANISGNPELNLYGDKALQYYAPSGSSSPVVNAGEDLGWSYNGSAPDLGVFEY